MMKVSLHLLCRLCRQAWKKSRLYRFTLMRGSIPKRLSIIPADPWPGDISAGRLLLDGKLLLSSQIISVADLWNPPGARSSALADLHSFSWLRNLRALGDNAARRLARQLLLNWVDRNQDWRAYAWKPGITGQRIANWIALYDFFCSSADESFRALFFRETIRQARHLTYSWQDSPTPLERFYALKGMIYSNIVFSKGIPHLDYLLPKLEQEIQSQLLPDGGHISRCPQIHLLVLRDLIDIRSILRLANKTLPSFLQLTISRMAPIVRLFRHGDGELATFGSDRQVSSSVIDMVLSLADVRGRPPVRAPHMGFERCVNKSGLLLLNTGTNGKPSIHPQNEHGTGMLNFEWSFGRDRFILQGDVILQTQDEQYFYASPPLNPKSLQMISTSQSGHTLLDGVYECNGATPFIHRRQLCLGGKQPTLRGEDTLQTPCEAFYGIRFVLDKNTDVQPGSGKQGFMIYINPNQEREPNQEKLPWRLLVSNTEEVLCEPFEDTQAIILLGRLISNRPHSIQWAFCQD